MSQCFDHQTTYLDTHGRIPLDRHIYASETIIRIRLQADTSNLNNKSCLASQPFVCNQHVDSCVYMYIYVYIYVYLSVAYPISSWDALYYIICTFGHYQFAIALIAPCVAMLFNCKPAGRWLHGGSCHEFRAPPLVAAAPDTITNSCQDCYEECM